jgi:hypothetical protein
LCRHLRVQYNGNYYFIANKLPLLTGQIKWLGHTQLLTTFMLIDQPSELTGCQIISGKKLLKSLNGA